MRTNNCARPLTRPARLALRTSPCTYEPAGTTILPSRAMGNRVSKYTGSPGFAFREEIAFVITSGICVPGVNTIVVEPVGSERTSLAGLVATVVGLESACCGQVRGGA